MFVGNNCEIIGGERAYIVIEFTRSHPQRMWVNIKCKDYVKYVKLIKVGKSRKDHLKNEVVI